MSRGLARLAELAGLLRSRPGSRHAKKQQKSTLRLHDNRASPVSRDPGIAMPGSRLTGLKMFHVIAFTGPEMNKPAHL